MANYSCFQIKVKGEKRNVFMFVNTLPVCDNIKIINKKESTKDLTLIFKGQTKWTLDAYIENSEDLKSINVKEYVDCNGKVLKEKFIYNTLEEKSKVWKIELDIFEEYEDYNPVENYGNLPMYKKIKNGKVIEENNYSIKEIKYIINDILKVKNILDNTFEYVNEIDEDYDEDFINNLKLKRKNGKSLEYWYHEWRLIFNDSTSAEKFMNSWIWEFYINEQKQKFTVTEFIKEGKKLGLSMSASYDNNKCFLNITPLGHSTTASADIEFAKSKFENNSCLYIIISCLDDEMIYPASFTYNLGEGMKQKIIHDIDFEVNKNYDSFFDYFETNSSNINILIEKLEITSEIEKENIKKFFE